MPYGRTGVVASGGGGRRRCMLACMVAPRNAAHAQTQTHTHHDTAKQCDGAWRALPWATPHQPHAQATAHPHMRGTLVGCNTTRVGTHVPCAQHRRRWLVQLARVGGRGCGVSAASGTRAPTTTTRGVVELHLCHATPPRTTERVVPALILYCILCGVELAAAWVEVGGLVRVSLRCNGDGRVGR